MAEITDKEIEYARLLGVVRTLLAVMVMLIGFLIGYFVGRC